MNLIDYLFDALHIFVICFNVFAWIPNKTRTLHFILINITACSWFVLGIWYGWGYCFLTDWHWSIKEQLGQDNLPGNYIAYLLEKLFSWSPDGKYIEGVIAVVFFFCFFISWKFFLSTVFTKKSK